MLGVMWSFCNLVQRVVLLAVVVAIAVHLPGDGRRLILCGPGSLCLISVSPFSVLSWPPRRKSQIMAAALLCAAT